jgi:protoporphyrinogen/coproporphyrinogen III oxidase
VGHLDLVEEIERALPRAVAVAGAGYRGSGLTDCINQGEAAAQRVLEAVPAGAGDARATLSGARERQDQ